MEKEIIGDILNKGTLLMATTGIQEIVKGISNEYIIPRLKDIYKNKRESRELAEAEYIIREYIERSYIDNLNMNTIVFKNKQKNINDLYIPLTLVKSSDAGNEDLEEVYIDKYREELIDKYKKIIVVDSAGMGKSTILKYMYLSAITEEKGVPILIELRRLNGDTNIIQYILKEINSINKAINEQCFLKLLEDGNFIFFFDGYDEIQEDAKTQVTRNIQDFISKIPKNKFVISSRDENEVGCFGDFQRFYIKRLKRAEAFNLIKKYDKNGELSKELIHKLKTEKNLKQIKEFLENPLMVSLLYRAFEYKKTIPYKKYIFYRQVYDALFLEHDLSKKGTLKRERFTKLDLEDFHCVLRCLAYVSLNQGISYEKEKMYRMLDTVLNKLHEIKFNKDDFIKDIIQKVPIFVDEGNEIRWAHKSFQDYFASCYIYYDLKETQHKVLEVMSHKFRQYYNILDIYYDLDIKGFSRYITYPILKEMKAYYQLNNYQPSEDPILKARNMRLEIMFLYNRIVLKILDKSINYDDMKLEDYNKMIPGYKEKNVSLHAYLGEYSISYWGNRAADLVILLDQKHSDMVQNISFKYETFNRKVSSNIISKMEAGEYEFNSIEIKNTDEIEEYKKNNIIISSFRFPSKILDYEKCMEKVIEIEKEINNDCMELEYL